jgi:hypothetical protein
VVGLSEASHEGGVARGQQRFCFRESLLPYQELSERAFGIGDLRVVRGGEFPPHGQTAA